MQSEKQFGELSEFKKHDVELYRSSDTNNTAIYFTDIQEDDAKRKNAKAFFEVLYFGLEEGNEHHLVYVRFPNTNFFVQMLGGHRSGRGIMEHGNFENVFAEDWKRNYTFYSFGDNAMLHATDLNEFNFMTKVASYDKGNPFNTPYPNETFVNYKEIEAALGLKYLKIPESIRRIAYCYKTKSENPVYFLVDFPAYNIKYENHRFFRIQNNAYEEMQIKNFTRYRDGGTTRITVADKNGTEHQFFSPTSLPEKTLCETWDNEELESVSDLERQQLIAMLNIELATENTR